MKKSNKTIHVSIFLFEAWIFLIPFPHSSSRSGKNENSDDMVYKPF